MPLFVHITTDTEAGAHHRVPATSMFASNYTASKSAVPSWGRVVKDLGSGTYMAC